MSTGMLFSEGRGAVRSASSLKSPPNELSGMAHYEAMSPQPHPARSEELRSKYILGRSVGALLGLLKGTPKSLGTCLNSVFPMVLGFSLHTGTVVRCEGRSGRRQSS